MIQGGNHRSGFADWHVTREPGFYQGPGSCNLGMEGFAQKKGTGPLALVLALGHNHKLQGSRPLFWARQALHREVQTVRGEEA